MPKTPAQRQRERRERLKCDPEAWEAYLKVDRSRKRAEYEFATPRELVKLRERSKACKKIEGKN